MWILPSLTGSRPLAGSRPRPARGSKSRGRHHDSGELQKPGGGLASRRDEKPGKVRYRGSKRRLPGAPMIPDRLVPQPEIVPAGGESVTMQNLGATAGTCRNRRRRATTSPEFSISGSRVNASSASTGEAPNDGDRHRQSRCSNFCRHHVRHQENGRSRGISSSPGNVHRNHQGPQESEKKAIGHHRENARLRGGPEETPPLMFAAAARRKSGRGYGRRPRRFDSRRGPVVHADGARLKSKAIAHDAVDTNFG